MSLQDQRLAISDSYDVEESVASSALFDGALDAEEGGCLLGGDRSNIEDLSGGDDANASLVEDAMLGVTGPPPPATPPPQLVSTVSLASSHPDDEENPPQLPDRPLLQPSTPRSDDDDDRSSGQEKPSTNKPQPKSLFSNLAAKVPTTITLPPHSPDASTVATPGGSCSILAHSSSDEPAAPSSSPKARKRWLLFAAAAAAVLLLLVGVGTALGMLLAQDQRNNAPSPSSSSSEEGSSSSSSGAASTPTAGPSAAPNTAEPSFALTVAPSASPTPVPRLLQVALQATSIERLRNASTPQGKAYRWLQDRPLETGANNATPSSLDVYGDAKLLQRYVLTVLDFALYPSPNETAGAENASTVVQPSVGFLLEDECDWFGVTCDAATTSSDGGNATSTGSGGIVTGLNWAGEGLTGSMPSEIGFLTALTLLDLGENQVHGTIPEELFRLTDLQFLYLHQNNLTGTLSEGFADLQKLERFYAGSNRLNGTFPRGLATTPIGANYTRRLGALSLYNNDFSGPLPSQTRWRQLWYLDLSHNRFSGHVPEDWVGSAPLVRLRHLYLDHNVLTGSLPSDFQSLGGGRIEQLLLSDNRFTGTVPGNYEIRNFVQQMELQNNQFTSLSNDICEMIVFLGGEMVNFRADCDICTCQSLCESGECYE